MSRSVRTPLKVLATSLFAGLTLLGGIAQYGVSAQESGSAQATPEATYSVIPSELTDYASDWPTAQGNLQATRNAVTAIDSSNVNSLEVAWRIPINQPGMAGSLTSNPVVAGDVVYIQDMQSNIYALDRATGAEIWRKDYGAAANGPNGVGLGYGMVFATVGADSTVVALDAATGEEIWNHRLAQSPGTGAQMAPIVYDGQVFVSTTPNGPTEY
jgi:alcohol dehydrogenase (cytochrome c)